MVPLVSPLCCPSVSVCLIYPPNTDIFTRGRTAAIRAGSLEKGQLRAVWARLGDKSTDRPTDSYGDGDGDGTERDKSRAVVRRTIRRPEAEYKTKVHSSGSNI